MFQRLDVVHRGCLALLLFVSPLVACAQSDDSHPDCDEMTAEQLGELIVRVDENARLDGNTWTFVVETLDVFVVYDTAADRMRIVIPIAEASTLDEARLRRVMQANFDSALDARYAIAQDMLWATFIHPLGSLSEQQFLQGLGETANIVFSYGTSYTSGVFIFGGGDSADIERQKLLERLQQEST